MEDYLIWNRYTKHFNRIDWDITSVLKNNSDNHFGFDIFFGRNYIDKYEGPLLCIKQTLDEVPISERIFRTWALESYF
ncbi:MAG: hypothetical protein BGO34_05125 [Bacteroidia bacterium 44-10]|nr:MAG: hypothetical protein BGO34_05125 [Bacteroidia bacterium 44-10]